MRTVAAHALLALLSGSTALAEDTPIVGIPWTGRAGVTETVAEIMERERLAPALPFDL
jgi:hypothetical protein